MSKIVPLEGYYKKDEKDVGYQHMLEQLRKHAFEEREVGTAPDMVHLRILVEVSDDKAKELLGE